MVESSQAPGQAVAIRAGEPGDLAAIVAIDAEIRGAERPEFWQERLTPYLRDDEDDHIGLVADAGGEIAGFVLGEVRGEEFELPPSGWVVTIGVRPAYRGQHVGQQLVQTVVEHLEGRGITAVRTMVGWDNADLLSFFGSLGFDCGPQLPLEKRLGAK